MKQTIRLLCLFLALATVAAIPATSFAETYYHNVSVPKMTEEIKNGVMTGRQVQSGTLSRSIGWISCDIASKKWSKYGVSDAQGKTYKLKSYVFGKNYVTWNMDAVYYSKCYAYMGTTSAITSATSTINAGRTTQYK